MATEVPYEILYQMAYDKLNGKTLKVLLCSVDSFVKATDKYVSDVSADEVSDASYARKTLASVVINKNTQGHAVWVDAADVVWTALNNVSPAVAYVYIDDVGGDTLSEIIAKIDHNDITADGGNVTLQIHATAGVLALNS